MTTTTTTPTTLLGRAKVFLAALDDGLPTKEQVDPHVPEGTCLMAIYQDVETWASYAIVEGSNLPAWHPGQKPMVFESMADLVSARELAKSRLTVVQLRPVKNPGAHTGG